METYSGSERLKVVLIAHTQFKNKDGSISNSDKLVAESAAISHAPDFKELDEKEIKKLIALIQKLGHESVFEHTSFTFEIDGISRTCTHQLVRHRLASYTQQSQRYVDLKNPKFIVPKSFDKYSEDVKIILNKVSGLYREMIESGIKKEDARFILPQAIETKIVATMNGRELRHFLKLRLKKSAQWEIRNLAKKMLEESYKVAPYLFEDLYENYIRNDE